MTPWGGAPESPPFHSPPTLSPTAESSEDRKARGLLKWWVSTRQVSPGAQRGCGQTEGSSTAWGWPVVTTEVHSLLRRAGVCSLGFGFLRRPREACPCLLLLLVAAACSARGHSTPAAASASAPGLWLSLGVSCKDACRWIQGQLRVLDDLISRPLTRSHAQRPFFQTRGRSQLPGVSTWTRVLEGTVHPTVSACHSRER